MKHLHVTTPVLDRAGEILKEPKTDSRGRIVLTNGEAKLAPAIGPNDQPLMEVVTVGRVMIIALDIQDEKIDPRERVSRFMLSVRIEEALRGNKPMEMSRDDEDLLSKVLKDKITNHMLLARSLAALDDAEKPKAEAKPNGLHAETAH